ncbi:hypothetical protein FGRMN_3865 [Neofusicoccum parvum]|uniref:Uncharacterized protein n=1 Tax=Neofusicoccum parvum TaxID=310453 RepID=A0ACB5SE48_9PEZI|nr:hypothetical protein FGRMN_3865 [Neofusicoccum parvum]
MDYFLRLVLFCFLAVPAFGFPLRTGNATTSNVTASNVTPFKIHFSEEKVAEMLQLVGLGKLPQPTYEGQHSGFGVTDEWLADAKQTWSNLDWDKKEEELNRVPQFMTTVEDQDGNDFRIHFAALLSENPTAQPLVLLHGWPGSIIEFFDLLPELHDSTSEEFHVIVPSLPGYLFSSSPPLSRNFDLGDVAFIVNKLMVNLGFDAQHGGYIAQGGDIGSLVAKTLALNHEECKGIHRKSTIDLTIGTDADDDVTVNMDFSVVTDTNVTSDPVEIQGLERATEFRANGSAYLREHATRPSTIGHVLASNPLALLAWIGEKFLEWPEIPFSTDFILTSVSLWWLTETFPTSIYAYRETNSPTWDLASLRVDKPLGFSWFPKDITPVPRSVIAEKGRLIYFKRHERVCCYAPEFVDSLSLHMRRAVISPLLNTLKS